MWTNPLTWIANQIVTAAQLNTHLRDNLNELRGGGIAMSGQDVNDFVYATSATQFGRVGVAGPGGSGKVPVFVGGSWVLAQQHPVGSIYENASDPTNPATLFGYGTWSALAPGRVLVAHDPSQTEFDTIGETGGTKTHTLSLGEIPSHAHLVSIGNGGSGTSIPSNTPDDAQLSTTSTSAVGGGGAHNNLQPYLVVYRWVRTA